MPRQHVVIALMVDLFVFLFCNIFSCCVAEPEPLRVRPIFGWSWIIFFFYFLTALKAFEMNFLKSTVRFIFIDWRDFKSLDPEPARKGPGSVTHCSCSRVQLMIKYVKKTCVKKPWYKSAYTVASNIDDVMLPYM